MQRSEDTDYQLATTTLEARWSGFEDGSQEVSYRVGLGSSEGSDDVSEFVAFASSRGHRFTGLSLQVNSVSGNCAVLGENKFCFVITTVSDSIYHTHTRTHARTHARTHDRTIACTHVRTHARTHTHTLCTHAHTQCVCLLCRFMQPNCVCILLDRGITSPERGVMQLT